MREGYRWGGFTSAIGAAKTYNLEGNRSGGLLFITAVEEDESGVTRAGHHRLHNDNGLRDQHGSLNSKVAGA